VAVRGCIGAEADDEASQLRHVKGRAIGDHESIVTLLATSGLPTLLKKHVVGPLAGGVLHALVPEGSQIQVLQEVLT
jgi:hypothetical protein